MKVDVQEPNTFSGLGQRHRQMGRNATLAYTTLTSEHKPLVSSVSHAALEHQCSLPRLGFISLRYLSRILTCSIHPL